MENDWVVFEEGQTIGKRGSEGGRIIFDEEIKYAARITLEEGGYTAPYSITMGIYYLLMHTHFCSNREEAQKYYSVFKTRIEEILALEGEDNEKCNRKIDELINLI